MPDPSAPISAATEGGGNKNGRARITHLTNGHGMLQTQGWIFQGYEHSKYLITDRAIVVTGILRPHAPF